MKNLWYSALCASLADNKCQGRLCRIFVVLSVFFLSMSARAQWDVHFSDYSTLRSYYNPAVSGVDGKLDVHVAYALQFAGYDNAPATMYFGGDLPVYFLSPRHGAGISFMNDKFGIFSTQRFAIQYAYNIAFGYRKRNRLSFGISGAMLTENINPDLELATKDDLAFPKSNAEGKVYDLGAGVYFCNPEYWAGLSTMHITAPTIEVGETNEIGIDRIYYLMGGGNIKIKNSLLSLQPSFMVQTDMQSWRGDLQCKVTYEYDEKKFYVGLGYSPKTSTTVMLGGIFHEVAVGYSYQMFTQGVGMLNGSHDITLSYQTDLDLFKKGKNVHRSVRFL